MGINLRGLWRLITGNVSTAGKVERTPSGIELSVYDADVPAALKISAVYSAVKLISDGVARLTLSLQRYNSAKLCYVDDYDNPLYTALRVRPNEYLNSFVFWQNTLQYVMLQGNGYILPIRDAYGDTIELILLSPESVYFDIYKKKYIVNDPVSGIVGIYSSSDIIHIKNVSCDGGYTGLPAVQLMAQSLGIIRLADSNTATTLSNGGRMRGLLSGAGGVNTFGEATINQLNDVSTTIETHIRDGRTVIPVPSDMKFQSISLSPADAKVLESKQITIRDIARFFRVHPSLIYEESNNTYKAAEVPNVMFLSQTLAPLLVQIETELLVKLIPRSLWGRKRIHFSREALYTTDLMTESSYYEKMLQTGVYTVNELRRRKGQAPVKGGDVPLVSANLKNIDLITSERNYEEKH